MMIKARNVFLIIHLLMLMILTSGCDAEPSSAVVVIVGNHQNTERFPISIDDDLYNIYGKRLLDLYLEQGQLYFMCVDGNPTVEYNEENEPIGKISDEFYSKYKDNEFILKQKLQEQTSLFSDVAETLVPNDAEVDTLAALIEAESIFENDYRQDRKIILYDTGLCTTGGLNFCQEYYFSKPTEEIVDDLSAELFIPQLEGVCVTWYGLGEVAEPQQQLTNVQKKKLQEIWTSILERGGATVEFKPVKHNDKLSNPEYEQPVSVVELSEIEKKEIQFLGGCGEFKSPDEAYETLEEVVELMKTNPDLTWYIVGCTARVDPSREYNYINLSKIRARAIEKELLLRGVPKEKIFLSALGFENPWYIHDLNEANLQIDEWAESNRKAYILSVRSDEFNENYDKIMQGVFE